MALTRRSALRLRRAEIPLLVVYGVLGIALTQFLYFAAIERLPIGIALLIEFTAPLMIAIWFRFGLGHPTKPAVWAALVAALVGLAIVAQVWEGLTLDPLGVAFAVGRGRRARGLLHHRGHAGPAAARRAIPSRSRCGAWARPRCSGRSSQPWWSFPIDGARRLAPAVRRRRARWSRRRVSRRWMVVLGTVLPFSLVVLSMQHLRASQASVVGMTEPIFATVIAWIVLGESFTPAQMVGAGDRPGRACSWRERNR